MSKLSQTFFLLETIALCKTKDDFIKKKLEWMVYCSNNAVNKDIEREVLKVLDEKVGELDE
jgi:hypothetical protein